MSQIKAESFLVTSPHLICLDKTKDSLTFSHFGNVLLYNSMQPELTLDILKKSEKPHTLSQLVSSMSQESKKNIKDEVQRLLTSNYLISMESSKEKKKYSGGILSRFVKNKIAASMLEEKLAKTKVGIIDFCNTHNNLVKNMERVGFRQITSVTTDIESIEKEVLDGNNLFVVVGLAHHKYYFSKINQLMSKNKKQWVLVMLDDFGGVMGPTFGVGGGPCYDCLIDQSKRHIDHYFSEAQYVNLIEKNRSPDFSNDFVARSIFPYLSIEVLKVVTQIARPMSFDGYFSFDFFNFRMQYSAVQPSPKCPVCTGLAG